MRHFCHRDENQLIYFTMRMHTNQEKVVINNLNKGESSYFILFNEIFDVLH